MVKNAIIHDSGIGDFVWYLSRSQSSVLAVGVEDPVVPAHLPLRGCYSIYGIREHALQPSLPR